MDKEQALDAAGAQHQANVEAIQRRGLHDRVVSKLCYWKALECRGLVLDGAASEEVAGLTLTLETVRADMIAAGQAPGEDALLNALGLS